MRRRSHMPATQEPQPLHPALRWLVLGLDLAVIGLVAWILMQLPLPVFEGWLPAKNVAVAVGAVMAGGKSLYDTLFYDRFWP